MPEIDFSQVQQFLQISYHKLNIPDKQAPIEKATIVCDGCGHKFSENDLTKLEEKGSFCQRCLINMSVLVLDLCKPK